MVVKRIITYGGEILLKEIESLGAVYKLKGETLISVEFLGDELEELIIPECVVQIQNCAFFSVKNVKKITLPKGLTEISSDCFAFLSALEEVCLFEGIKKIGKRAFIDCKSLKQLIIPEGVQEIGECAFTNCHALEKIYIPKTVKKVGKHLFLNCSNLTVECEAEKPSALWSREWNKFNLMVNWGVKR